MRKIFVISSGAALWFAWATAGAHHSNAPHYDRERPITIEGVVEEFEFVNPHAFLHIRAENESGESVVWACEMQTANTLRRQGWTEERFTVGQIVMVQGIAARRDPLGCSFTSAELTDGTTIARSGAVVSPPESAAGDAPREPAAGDMLSDNTIGDAPRAAFLEGGVPNLAGPWMRDRSRGRGGPGPGSARPGADRLTPAGLAAAEGYDERFDDPSFECSASSITRAWSEPGTPTDIEQHEDRVVIRHEYMDTVRTIHLASEHDPALTPQPYGHSIGRYESSTLVVDTVGFAPGVLTPHPGILHSGALHVTERLTVDPDERVLLLEWTAEDPEFFLEPFSGTNYYIPSLHSVSSYDCTPELSNR